MKNYLIIGASSGIGKELANKLKEAGNNVYATYCNTPVEESESNLEFQYLDVKSDSIELKNLPEKIDGLVYSPGSINLKPFNRIKPEEFTEDFNLQVTGAVKVIQYVLPILKMSDSASIVLFSTVAVQTGFNFHSQVSASKGAIEGLTKALAAEFAPKIRVNCIAPSLTDTPLAEKFLKNDQQRETGANRHPLKRIGKADDIASAAEFLLSEKSGWITGQIIHVDGGMSSIKI